METDLLASEIEALIAAAAQQRAVKARQTAQETSRATNGHRVVVVADGQECERVWPAADAGAGVKGGSLLVGGPADERYYLTVNVLAGGADTDGLWDLSSRARKRER